MADDWEEPELDGMPAPVAVPKRASRAKLPSASLATESKAHLIERYLYGFVMVTKSGSYIDGFAGPQNPDHPENWSAYRVVTMEPRWLRHFFLFEENDESFELVEELRRDDAHRGGVGEKRTIDTFHGDFNARVHEILRPDVIGPREPTFCLLDQRTFECHWATVVELASYRKEGFKLELFYFLANKWLDRAAGGLGADGTRARAWWGRDDWRRFIRQAGARRAAEMVDRFRDELGYAYVNPYSIRERRSSGPVMYYMIHASDHHDAPGLMDRAYIDATRLHDDSERRPLPFRYSS